MDAQEIRALLGKSIFERANVCELQGEALGLFIIEVINEHDGVPKAKAYFDEHGLSWKEVDA